MTLALIISGEDTQTHTEKVICRDGDRDWGNVAAKSARDCQEPPEARMRQGKILSYVSGGSWPYQH